MTVISPASIIEIASTGERPEGGPGCSEERETVAVFSLTLFIAVSGSKSTIAGAALAARRFGAASRLTKESFRSSGAELTRSSVTQA
jgi:hypothetical protein